MPGKASPFSAEQRIWIVTKFAELKSATLARQAFRKEFAIQINHHIPNDKQFNWVIEKCNGCDYVSDPKPKPKPDEKVPLSDVQAIKDYFDSNGEAHLREASHDLNMSVGKIWFVLRKILKWKSNVPVSSVCSVS